ncbi:MAG: hypothetical protein U0930_19385 [Pirellulales bacterium]
MCLTGRQIVNRHFTAKVGESIELMRVDLAGRVTQLAIPSQGFAIITLRIHPMDAGCYSDRTEAERCNCLYPKSTAKKQGR